MLEAADVVEMPVRQQYRDAVERFALQHSSAGFASPDRSRFVFCAIRADQIQVFPKRTVCDLSKIHLCAFLE
jgi:hypothetical protein